MEKHYNSPRLRAKYKEMNNEPKIKSKLLFIRKNGLDDRLIIYINVY